MARTPSQRKQSHPVAGAGWSTSISRRQAVRASLRNSACIRTRRGHDRLELIDSKAYVGNNSGRVLDQVTFPSTSSNQTLAVRRELWQEKTPATQNFPHIRPPNQKRRRLRSVFRKKGARLRRGLSVGFYSYYWAAKFPFLTSKRWRGLDKANLRNSMALHKTNDELMKTRASMRLSQSWSPAQAALKPDPVPNGRSALPIRSAVPSPLACHPPTTLSEPTVASQSSQKQHTILPPPAIPTRSALAKNKKRDSFARAKIHVRRPPKGTVHWFDAYDDVSDEEDPNDPNARPVRPDSMGAPAFQPALGPNRHRAAPTHRVNSSSDTIADYFSSRDPTARKHLARNLSPSTRIRRKQESQYAEVNPLYLIAEKSAGINSVRSMSSDDEDFKSRPSSSKYWDMSTPSPGSLGQIFLRRTASHRKASINTHTARQSMASGMSSATLPFMLKMTPGNPGAPSLPDTPPDGSPDFLPISYYELTGLLPGSSGGISPVSEITSTDARSSLCASTPLSAASHLIAVTDEEMALLDMMRRKRAMMQEQKSRNQSQSQDKPVPRTVVSGLMKVPTLVPEPLRPLKKAVVNVQTHPLARSNDERKASASSTITLESGENMEFPTPPTIVDTETRPSSKGSRRGSEKHFTEQSARPTVVTMSMDENSKMPAGGNAIGTALAPSPTRSYWSPEIPTPVAELDGNPFGAPMVLHKDDERPGTSSALRLLTTFSDAKRPDQSENEEDSFSLSVEFADLHLPPLLHPGCNDLAATKAENERGAEEQDEELDSFSPGLTDGDSSSSDRRSRSEIETPSKACQFTANAFEIVDSDCDAYESGNGSGAQKGRYGHYRAGTPLLAKVDNMYAFADESHDVEISLEPRSAADADRASNHNVLSAFRSIGSYTTAAR